MGSENSVETVRLGEATQRQQLVHPSFRHHRGIPVLP